MMQLPIVREPDLTCGEVRLKAETSKFGAAIVLSQDAVGDILKLWKRFGGILGESSELSGQVADFVMRLAQLIIPGAHVEWYEDQGEGEGEETPEGPEEESEGEKEEVDSSDQEE